MAKKRYWFITYGMHDLPADDNEVIDVHPIQWLKHRHGHYLSFYTETSEEMFRHLHG